MAEFTDDRGDSGQRVYFTELLKTQALDTGILRQVLAQASREMDSDYELASLLIDNARTFMSDDPTRQGYIAVAEKLGSHEQGQVFAALVKSESRK